MDWPRFPSLSRPKSGRCLLLELPPELRDLIYEYTLQSNPGPNQLVTFKLDHYQRDTLTQAVQPPLLHLNRQIRQETLPLFYSTQLFILHSEGTKADDARRWLMCNAPHLRRLRHLEIWIRYTTPANRFTSSNGAVGIMLHRDRNDESSGGEWNVQEDGWRWITVVRKPANLEIDAAFLIREVRRLLREDWPGKLTAAGLYGVLVDLREGYVKEKMG
ncbi:hypothetical protein KC332_g1619 [Hortaea werneckii]|uniref:2EXR domain-containing protein n=2 Tax=Hortaea werneckii TaxID=91943 RepID=A0A3M7IDY1_HORWE|nr:hypothetical protein KC358_g13766 [Hortaea werneckii]OTA23517.1 hypothetical protein BTJ68_13388 [Hortaea werneckii EXF-2000]KAI6845723.1 hypothetical protein KC350_g4268 [Hortaea werneckii]KAI6908789.1 hypothetical protein KC348_g13735 [Hortaea werneckii]KAI6933510.1 hypothetical protein KC341_g8268 [Hortaea werneckii]